MSKRGRPAATAAEAYATYAKTYAARQRTLARRGDQMYRDQITDPTTFNMIYQAMRSDMAERRLKNLSPSAVARSIVSRQDYPISYASAQAAARTIKATDPGNKISPLTLQRDPDNPVWNDIKKTYADLKAKGTKREDRSRFISTWFFGS